MHNYISVPKLLIMQNDLQIGVMLRYQHKISVSDSFDPKISESHRHTKQANSTYTVYTSLWALGFVAEAMKKSRGEGTGDLTVKHLTLFSSCGSGNLLFLIKDKDKADFVTQLQRLVID